MSLGRGALVHEPPDAVGVSESTGSSEEQLAPFPSSAQTHARAYHEEGVRGVELHFFLFVRIPLHSNDSQAFITREHFFTPLKSNS
ncbi:hypothetical protein CDAR_511921 [Caerostris darwini]|uniref:Uncharacterized protein n=1 Tax=Caerostris darwini TaxID=1538125 RepID=A0AAV4P4F5_9ARAC|nr:hypothetical protein CDAR_511921 [Caerostris darwini]